MSEVGSRIVVYGPAGSGKTTVAASIAGSIGIPHIELDAIFWLPDWVSKSWEQFREDVSIVLAQYPEGWVCDGNYSHVRDLVLPMADTVIWLRLPFPVVFWQLLRRTVSRSVKKEVLWGNNYESLRLAFFSRDSLLLYVIRRWRRHQRLIKRDLKEIPNQARVIELHSAKEIEALLNTLGPDGSGTG
ncbi:MAG: AAA family ATPase [Dehalococcoidales bacterium]|nr:MAG: AAA family ATPase [Dehalococcoidales bacterium]